MYGSVKAGPAVLALAVWLGSVTPASAGIITTVSTADTTLIAGNQTANVANDYLVVGNTGAVGRRHTLLNFGSIASLVGSGQQISSATLTLTRLGTAAGAVGPVPPDQIGVFAVARPWTEGNGSTNGTPNNAGATWLAAQVENGINWTNPGGDFVGTTGVQGVSPFATGTGGPNVFTFDVTALVQALYAGTVSDNGFALVPLTTDGNVFGRVVFLTSDSPTVGTLSQQPTLSITFSSAAVAPVPEPATLLTGAALLVCGAAAWRRGRRPAIA